MKIVTDAVYARWNAAGLDSSIAELYPSGDDRSGDNPTGPPEGTTGTRAEVTSIVNPPSAKTRGSRYQHAISTIKVWGKPYETVAGYLDTIEDKYLNADEQGMTMPTGYKVMEVEPGGKAVMKSDDDLHMGVITILVRFQKNNTVPSS